MGKYSLGKQNLNASFTDSEERAWGKHKKILTGLLAAGAIGLAALASSGCGRYESSTSQRGSYESETDWALNHSVMDGTGRFPNYGEAKRWLGNDNLPKIDESKQCYFVVSGDTGSTVLDIRDGDMVRITLTQPLASETLAKAKTDKNRGK